MQHTKDIELDGRSYSTTQYSTSKGLDLLERLGRIVAEPLATMVAGGMDADVSASMLSLAARSLFTQLQPGQLKPLCESILSTTQYRDGDRIRQIIFDTDFAGRYGHLARLIKEVLFFQFNDFLPESVSGLNLAPEAPRTVRPIKAR